MSPDFRRRVAALTSLALAGIALLAPAPATANLSHRDTDTTVGAAGMLRVRLMCAGYSSTSECSRGAEPRALFKPGQIVPASFGQPVGYVQLNKALRAEYHLDEQPDYVFTSGFLYVIDHRTRAVQRVIPVVVAR
jgi:hypothetical protein